jgi:hypothetical protein
MDVPVMMVVVMMTVVMARGLRERGDGECRQQRRDDQCLDDVHGVLLFLSGGFVPGGMMHEGGPVPDWNAPDDGIALGHSEEPGCRPGQAARAWSGLTCRQP